MKRFLFACVLCTAMLATAVFVFMPAGMAKGLFPPAPPAKENVLEALLDLPAPPPLNPLEPARAHDEAFYDPQNPPPDNAPIEDLIDYWTRQTRNGNRAGYYRIKASARVTERLLAEEEKQPGLILGLLAVLPDDKRTVDVVRSMYDNDSKGDDKKELRNWLTMNSSYFADDLERVASRTHDVGGYVTLENEDHVLALSKYDWERARPIVDRMYSDSSQPATRVLGTWALYKHAMESGDVGDTDRYRSELMKLVEDRSLPPGIRDKANDALTHEADFPGRDDWAFGLFEDETWVRLPQYTGLTTLVMESPPEKYEAKLIELAASKSKIVRTAAVRCLVTVLERKGDKDVVRALLPWVSDPDWVELEPSAQGRSTAVNFLQNNKMPESVPALIAAIDEKATRQVEDYSAYSNSNSANTIATYRATNTIVAARNAMNAAAEMMNSVSNMNVARKIKEETYYPLRDGAVRALAFQADPRAVPVLKKLLVTAIAYQRTELMAAIMNCGGYSVPEQVDALEKYARKASEIMSAVETEGANNSYANAYYNRGYYEAIGRLTQGEDLEESLGMMVALSREPSDDLAHSVIARIEKLEPKDPTTARALRQIIVSWKGVAISALLLHDLKMGKAESAAIVRLLSERKLLREKLSPDVDDLHNGTPIAAGVSACLIDDANIYAAVLESKSAEARTAMLACARLVRAELPLAKVADELKSTDALLRSAGELYLESEDSPEARSMVYALHAGEAKVLGATLFFKGRNNSARVTGDVNALFASVGVSGYWAPYMNNAESGDLQKIEERLQKEVKEEADLIGVYAYQDNFVRVFRDRVTFSWEDDPSRYHERDLSSDEFKSFKELLTAHHVGEMKPFLTCSAGCGGNAKELLMLGKNGGSRVFIRSDRVPDFFAELEKMLTGFRAEPSAIKYALSKEVPGLELLFASEELDAETVWKQGRDLRIVVSNKAVREKVDDEISQMEEAEQDDQENSDEEDPPEITMPAPTPDMVSPSERMRIKREYEGYAWHRVENGRLGDPTAQPPGIEYIPPRDQFEVQPDEETWKARTGTVEIRADDSGLFKIVSGKITKLKAGRYRDPVITPNGRWAIVSKMSDDEGQSLVRYNLITNREYDVAFEGEGNLYPRCYVPSIGKYLVVAGYYEEGYYEPNEGDDDEQVSQMRRFYTMDPETGAVLPVNGEARPLSAQTFRPLQPTTRPNEFWAALPNHDRGDTVVGKFDSRLLKFTPVLKLPKINFSTMDMWVDESEDKVYFVYSGHLLRVPLKIPQPK